MRFQDLQPPLSPLLLQSLESLQFTTTTPVQSSAIPLFLSKKDVCVNACTGSGKTLSFLIPIIQILSTIHLPSKVSAPSPKLVSLILSPTRELAQQTFQTLQLLLRPFPNLVHPALLVGGDSLDTSALLQHELLIFVGSPGRVLDVLCRTESTLSLQSFEILILDEADTLLDFGFQQTINSILQKLPKQRRTGLFSATQTRQVKDLARAGLRNPVTVSVKSHARVTPDTLENYYYFAPLDQRLSALLHFLQTYPMKKCLIFFATCASVDFFGIFIEKLQNTMEIVKLHGKMAPKKRNKHFKQFLDAPRAGLVCTDVCARGLDLEHVDFIIQYDPPQNPDFFVHRVGRTARANREGQALTFLSSEEDVYIHYLKIRQVPMTPLPEAMLPPLSAIPDILPRVRAMVLYDRDVLVKGTKAFVAFVRSYKEHQCQYVFRFEDLNWTCVARAFALLRMPKIKELRNVTVGIEEPEVPIAEIPFRDKVREKDRQKNFALMREAEKKERIEKSKAKKVEKNSRRREKKKGTHQMIVDEWNELAEEERNFKRLKRGKMSETEYDEQLLNGGMIEHEEKETIVKKKRTKKEAQKREICIRKRKGRNRVARP